VAFFFLFLLHGFSIGTRQQGISYNVFGLGEVAEYKTSLELQMFKLKIKCQ
jgi:hypothetical protein